MESESQAAVPFPSAHGNRIRSSLSVRIIEELVVVVVPVALLPLELLLLLEEVPELLFFWLLEELLVRDLETFF